MFEEPTRAQEPKGPEHAQTAQARDHRDHRGQVHELAGLEEVAEATGDVAPSAGEGWASEGPDFILTAGEG